MHNTVLRAAMATAIGLGVSAPAGATLFIEGGQYDCDDCDKSQLAQADTGTRHYWRHDGEIVIAQTGQGPAGNYNGFGKAMSLEDALDLVLPEGWTKRFASGVDPHREVTWASEGTWVDALFEILKASEYAARVSWAEQSVVVHDEILRAPGVTLPEVPETASKAPEEGAGSGATEGGTIEPFVPADDPVMAEQDEPEPIGPTEFPAGEVEENLGAFMAAWGREIYWKSSLEKPLITRFSIPLSGMSFQDDLDVILGALNEGRFDVEADEYQNGIVVISVER